MADAIARFHRMDGKDTFFLSGTDEHGQKVERTAQKLEVNPIDFVDEKSKTFRDLLTLLHCSNNDFIRTTEARHRKKVEELWQELVSRDLIYLGHYEGWYSVTDEAFYSEREVVDGRGKTRACVLSHYSPSLAYSSHITCHYSRTNWSRSGMGGGRELLLSTLCHAKQTSGVLCNPLRLRGACFQAQRDAPAA